MYLSEDMIGTDKISEIVNKIATGYNPDKIILFGSYASGNPSDDSDLDLFVIKDSDLPRRFFNQTLLQLDKKVP